jgi:hypothetical protein
MASVYLLVYPSELFNVLVRRAKAGQADFLREFGKIWIRKHRNVSEQLVTNVGLLSVGWHGVVSNKLCAMKHPESQAS